MDTGASSAGSPRRADSSDEEIWDLAAANAHAADLLAEGRPADALERFHMVHDRCRALLGGRHPATLTVGGNVAVTTVSAGKRRPGVALLEACVTERAETWGDEDPRTLTARDALAVAHRLAGNVDEAVELSTLVTAQRTRVLGPHAPDTLTSRMGLVHAKAAAGDFDEAAAVLAAALVDAELAHGRRHPNTRSLRECGEHLGLLHLDR